MHPVYIVPHRWPLAPPPSLDLPLKPGPEDAEDEDAYHRLEGDAAPVIRFRGR
jgi:hypothetical protein